MHTQAPKPILPGSCLPALAGWGFTEPTYTQCPNDLIAMMPLLSDPELRILLTLVRYTLGYHRTTCTASYSEIAKACHLSRRSVISTCTRLQEAGLITHVRRWPRSEWRLNICEDTHIHLTPGQPTQKTPDEQQLKLGFARNRTSAPGTPP